MSALAICAPRVLTPAGIRNDFCVLIERGTIAHRARSADLLADRATLDRYVGLDLARN